MEKKVIIQFFKFAVVGGINTLINMGVLFIFTEYFKIYYLISAIFAFMVAVTNSFILNKIWTFKEDIKERVAKKYSKFFIISIIALLVNLFFLFLLTDVFKLYYLISQIIAICLSLWINFFGNKLWTFKR
jgi:putative flippase GtrA